MIMIRLSDAVLAKAVDLGSMTIDSPTGRVSKRSGAQIRPTVYFDKYTVDKKTGKKNPAKGANFYTPNADEAEAIENCTQDKVHTVKYPDGTVYRFLDSKLEEENRDEIARFKGMKAVDDVINVLDSLMKKATSAYIMQNLDEEQRSLFANAIGGMVLNTTNRLKSAPQAKEKKARLTLWS
jgi:hypothetical protein